MYKTLLWVCSLLFAVDGALSTTYYVRTDGGSASQCTGSTDAAYPGAGSAQPCAWDHPFQALPPGGSPRISGGDSLVIGPGSYEMGIGAPATANCEADYAWDCHMPAIPSGLGPSQRTRILGRGWNSGCADPPELWGSERALHVMNLTDSSHVELACLEITDHSGCIEDHSHGSTACPACTVSCRRDTPPFGDWAPVGLYAEDSTDVALADLRIHGLAVAGVHAGRLTDWTVERVRILANGWVGWDGDLGEPSSNSGTLVFKHLEVAWNGCGETWPAEQVRLDTCWGQEAGGYGDGIGLTNTTGHWVIEDSEVHHNTSDGVDLLYLVSPASAEIRRLVARGNAGNQLKSTGDVIVENSLLVSDCAYFETASPLMTEGDHCRATGSTVSMHLVAGSTASLINSTVTGEGDCLLITECREGETCDGSESLVVRNTLFLGQVDWAQNFEQSCLYYSGLVSDPVDFDYNLVWATKDDHPCPVGAHDVCQDPTLVDATLDGFDGHLSPGSPAINAGTASDAPAADLDGNPRVDAPDIGAYEQSSAVFQDGFESGDSSRWSARSPGSSTSTTSSRNA